MMVSQIQMPNQTSAYVTYLVETVEILDCYLGKVGVVHH
jgi:hypothetical protein